MTHFMIAFAWPRRQSLQLVNLTSHDGA